MNNKTSFHFIKCKQRTMLTRDITNALKEPVLRNNDACVHHHRLEDHPGDRPGVRLECALQRGEIVIADAR